MSDITIESILAASIMLMMVGYFGAMWGSFATVLVSRWREKKGGICRGRSECPHCHHTLGVMDLFPIFSYLFSRGKCRYCQAPISPFYIGAELLMGSIFGILYISLFGFFGIPDFSLAIACLFFFGFVTGVYVLYDIRYMEIPDQIMIPAIVLLIIGPILGLLFGNNSNNIDYFMFSWQDQWTAAWILYTFFYIQILIPGLIFLIRQKNWKVSGELLMSYFTFPILMIVDFFRSKKQDENATDEVEIPAWIGGGDLRIAIFIGLTLGWYGILAVGIAYIIGSIVGIIWIIKNRIQSNQSISTGGTTIPFGPFLGIGWILTIVFIGYEQSIVGYTFNKFFIGQ